MSREEAMQALIESGMELRRDDIELGKKQERERIIKLLEPYSQCQSNYYCWPRCECVRSDFFLGLIKGEQK